MGVIKLLNLKIGGITMDEKEKILEKIEDPYQKDWTYAVLTAKECFEQTQLLGVGVWCYYTCVTVMEVGDHFASLLCYAGCSAWTGYVSYRGFRKVWQNISIPFKSFIFKFFRRA